MDSLQVDIVFSPEKAKAQIAAAMAEIGAADIQATTKTVRTKEEIFAKSREKEHSAALRQLSQREAEESKRAKQMEQMWSSTEKTKSAIAKATASEIINYESSIDKARQSSANAEMARQKALRTMQIDMAKSAAQQSAIALTASPAGIVQGKVGEVTGLKNQIAEMRAYRDEHGRTAQEIKIAEAQIHKFNQAINLATVGNVRARGEFHQMTAKLASLTFEVTGAVYGFTMLAGVFAAPAMFGVAMLKRIEDARTGVTGILLSMAELNGKALDFGQAWEISGKYVKQVQADSMKYGIDMGKLMEVNQAAMSGGLNAMLNLSQIQQVATAGAIAVSSLGLNSQQYVQEVRDLISGGIQPASSTLARSIGVTDSLLKQWKAEGPDKLIKELTERLQGFMVVADEVRSKTLTGAWDILQARLSMLLSDEQGFGALKNVVIDVANFIGKVDLEGKFALNPNIVSVAKAYWEVLKSIGGALLIIGDILAFLSPMFAKLAQLLTIIELNSQLLLTTVSAGINQVLALSRLDFKSIREIGKTWGEDTSKLTDSVEVAAYAFLGVEMAAKKAAEAADDTWESVTGKGLAAIGFEAMDKMYDRDVKKQAEHNEKVKKLNEQVWADQMEYGRIYYEAMETMAKISAQRIADINKPKPTTRMGEFIQGSIIKAQISEYEAAEKIANESMARIGDINKKYPVWLADVDDPKKGRGAKHQSVMEQIKLEMLAKTTSSDKELSNVERVELAWKKLKAETYAGLKPLEQRKETAQHILALEAAKLADVKDAHEKIISTLKREAEHYDKLGKKEPTQIEAIQADVKVREARLKVLQDEIDLRKLLVTAPTDAEKAQMLGRIQAGMLTADLNKPRLSVPSAPRGRSDYNIFSATGGSDITEATQTAQDLFAKSDKQFNFFTTDELIEQALEGNKTLTKAKKADANSIGLETLKIEEANAKIGMTREQENILELGKVQKHIDESSGSTKKAYQEQLFAIQKKNEAELSFERRKDFVALFDGLLAPGTNVMKQLASNFGKALNQHIQSALSNVAMNIAAGKSSETKSSDWVMMVVGILGSIISSNSASAAEIAAVTAVEVQKRQGTGTVAGDALAQSKSLNNSMDILNKTSFATNKYTIQMADSLKVVENSIKSFVNVMAKSLGGDIAGSMGVARASENAQNLKVNVPNWLWGSAKDVVTDTGLFIKGTLGDLIKGVGDVWQYTSGVSKSSGLLGTGIGSQTLTWTQGQKAPEELGMALADVYTNMKDVFKSAGESIGADVTSIDSTFNMFETSIGKLSLEGLNAEQKMAALSAAISKDADLLAESMTIKGGIFEGWDKFQVANEGMYQTIIRVVAEIAVMDDYFSRIGVTSKTTAENADALITALGGVDAASSKLQGYYANFFTDAERSAHDVGVMGEQFKKIGLTMPTTNEEFRKLVESQDLATTAGIETYAALIDVSDAFNAVTAAAEAAQNASITAAQEQYKLVLSEIDALKKFGVSVRDLMDSLRRGDQAPTAMAASTLRNEFMAINALAASGDIAAQGKLAGAATDFLTASKAQANSALEYARDFAHVQSSLNTTATSTEDIVSAAELSLQAAVDANTFLQDIATNTKDTKNNITSLVAALGALPQSIVDAGGTVPQGMIDGMTSFNKAVTTSYGQLQGLMQQGYGQLVQAMVTKLGGTTTGTTGGVYVPPQITAPAPVVAPVAAPLPTPIAAPLPTPIAAPTVSEAYIQSQANIEAKAAARDYMLLEGAKALASTDEFGLLSPSAFEKFLTTDKIENYTYSITAYDRYIKAKNTYEALPEFAVGSNYIDRDMIAKVHAGEEITPRPYVDMQRSERNETNRLLAEFRDSFIQELRAMAVPLIQNTRDSAKQLTRWELDGLPETRVVTA